ncbi:MAG: GNAT family N-acetyltransferase [Caulobacter sp.]|nr:GNAT family N-acetyltransferase [Caulobacter sp.]
MNAFEPMIEANCDPPPIRRLHPGEGPVFQALRLAAFAIDETCFASSLAEERAKPPGWFEDRVREGGLFIAERDGRALGMLGLALKTNAKEAHKGFIWSMFVLPEGRGQGLGAALMAAVLDHAAARGLESVHLAVVSTNAPAIAIYEAAGFERYGLEPRALKTAAGYTDDLLMWKRLL